MTDKNREKIFSILSASRQQSLRRNPLYGIVDNPLPAPAWQGVQDIPLDEFMDAPLAESRARQDANRLEAEREVARRSMPMGMGTLTEPFVNTILEPERRESVARNVGGAVDWLGDVGADIAGYVGSGRAGRDASRVVEQTPSALAGIPDAVGGVARQAPGAVERLGSAIGQGYDWVSNQADPEMFEEPSFIGGVGSLAVEYGPDILRGLTYGPWENERRLQSDIDLQEARRARGLPVDEGAINSAADAANLETIFAGLNAGFAPADVPMAVGAAGRVARETGETVSQAGRAVSDVINSNPVLRDYVVPWNQGWWGGRAVGVAGGGAAGAALSEAEDLQGRLTDAGVGAGVGWFAGAPIGAVAMTAPRAVRDISRLGDDVIRALPWEEPPIRDVEFSVAPAGAEPELRAYRPDEFTTIRINPDGEIHLNYQGSFASGGGSGGEAVRLARSVQRALNDDIAATGRAEYHWRPGGSIDEPDEKLAQFYRSFLRNNAPQGYVFSETHDGVMHLRRVDQAPAPLQGVGLGDDAPAQPAPLDTVNDLDQWMMGGYTQGAPSRMFVLDDLIDRQRRLDSQMAESPADFERPPSYSELLEIGRDELRAGSLPERLSDYLGPMSAGGRLENTPLLSAPVLAAGATGATAGALLTPQEAEASDGGEGDGMEAPMLPILGGIGAATIAALARGRPIARELNSQTGMFAGINARTADRAALARAQEMAASGASRDDIWRDTGWFQGVDGKWRFEIDDSGARIAPDMLARHSAGRVGSSQRRPLSDGLQHPELNDAYDLSDTTLDFGRLSRGAVGEYDNSRRSISIYAADDPDMLRSGTLHEVQHRAQREEGFATGGTPESAWGVNEQASLDAIRSRKKEVLAGRDPYAIQNRIAAGYQIADEDMAALEQWRELTRQEDQILANTLSPREAYRRLAGETEARNVQTRRDFTPEERRARPPWETQDVPDDQQIIRFDGNRAESASPLRGVGLSRGRMVAAIRDPETGRIFSGANHADAIAEAPEAIQPRLEAIYARNPNGADVGFMRGEEFFNREEAMAAMQPSSLRRANQDPQPSATGSGTEADFPALRGTGNVREPERFWDDRLTDQQNQVARWALTGRNSTQIADAMAEEGFVISAEQVGVVLSNIKRRAPDVHAQIGPSQRGRPRGGMMWRVSELADELAAQGISGRGSGHVDIIAERLRIPREEVMRHLSQARFHARKRNGGDPLAGVGLAALAGGGAALAAGDADAQEMTADGRSILPRPEGVDWSQGQWQGPWQRVGSLEDGTPTVRRLQVMPDGSEYYVVGVQDADGIRYLGYLEPTEGAPGAAPDPFAGTGSRESNYVIGDPSDHSGEEEEPQSGNGLGTAERIALGLGAGLAGRFGSRALGAGRLESEFLGFGAGAGGNLLAGGDMAEAAGVGAGTMLSGIGADELLNYSPRLRVGEDFADRARQFALTLPDEAPRERVLRLDRQTGDVMASDGGAERLSPRSEFLASPLEDQIAWMRREGVPIEAAPDQSLPFGLDDVPLIGRLRGAEEASPDAWVWDDVTRASRRGPDAPAPDPERVMRGLEVQRMVRDTPQGPATAPIGFFDPDTGKPLFGTEPKPRRQTQRPPLEERATERGAVGALQGVNASTLRRIASDLDLETQGVGVADLRRTLAKNLGRNFDSTRELVAFLERYGVTGLTIGAIGAGAASGALDPIDGVGL